MKIINILFTAAFLAAFAAGCTKSSDSSNNQVTPPCTWTTVFSDNFIRTDTNVGSIYKVIIRSAFQQQGGGYADIFQNSLRVNTFNAYWAVVDTNAVPGTKTRVSVECTTPVNGTPLAFAVGGRFILAGDPDQSGYFAGALPTGVGIYKLAGDGTSTPLGTPVPFTVKNNRTYKLEFTLDGNTFTIRVTDQTDGSYATMTCTDGGSMLSGQTYTINGNSINGNVVLLFDNFKIERCQ